jgi:diacylglycerol kinase family enzyme
VEVRQTSKCLLRFHEPVRYEVDGEVYLSKGREITIENVPGALTIFVPEPEGGP